MHALTIFQLFFLVGESLSSAFGSGNFQFYVLATIWRHQWWFEFKRLLGDFFFFFFFESFANRSIQKYSYVDHTEVENRSIVIKEMTCYLENERFHRCQVDTKIKNFSGTRVDRFGLRMSHTRFGSSDDLRIGTDVSWWIKNYISRYNVLWILWILWSSIF